MEPVYGQYVNITVPQKKGYQIFKIVINDPDIAKNNELIYFLESEEINYRETSNENRKHENLFKINSSNGDIFLDQPVLENYLFSFWKINVTIKDLLQEICHNCPHQISRVEFIVHFTKSYFEDGFNQHDVPTLHNQLQIPDSSKIEEFLDLKKWFPILIPLLIMVSCSLTVVAVILIYKFLGRQNNQANKETNPVSKHQETHLLETLHFPNDIQSDEHLSENYQGGSPLITGSFCENQDEENNNLERLNKISPTSICFHMKSQIPADFSENLKDSDHSIKIYEQNYNILSPQQRSPRNYIFEDNENANGEVRNCFSL